MKLLTTSSAKLDKSQNNEWLNAILYLDPTFNKNVCPNASAGCRKACLINAGMMSMPTQAQARRNRTALYYADNTLFMKLLYKEINALIRKAERENKKLAIRLNGTSDINWYNVYNDFKQVMFYEYTKRTDVLASYTQCNNLHITFSRTENTTDDELKQVLAQGVNVAVVFDDKMSLPKMYKGYSVINGDETDRRFEDKQGQIVGLKLKGKITTKAHARKTGFAVGVEHV